MAAIATPLTTQPAQEVMQQWKTIHSVKDRMAQIIANRFELELRYPRQVSYSENVQIRTYELNEQDVTMLAALTTAQKILHSRGYNARFSTDCGIARKGGLYSISLQEAKRRGICSEFIITNYTLIAEKFDEHRPKPSQEEISQQIIDEVIANLKLSQNGKHKTVFKGWRDLGVYPLVVSALKEEGYQVKESSIKYTDGKEGKIIDVAFPVLKSDSSSSSSSSIDDPGIKRMRVD